MIAVLYYQDCHLQYIQNLFVLAILLNAGNKDTQSKDIEKALEIIEEVYKRN